MQETVLQMRGIVLDLPPDEIPRDHWSFGRNMFFRDLATQRIPGYSSYYAAQGEQPVFSYPVQRKASSYWLIVAGSGADTLVYRWDGSAALLLHTYPGLDPLTVDWQGTDHNGVICLNNGQAAPRYWNETGNTLDELPGWQVNLKCRALRSFKNHLFALGLSDLAQDSPYEYAWSDASPPGALPQTWAAAPGNDAGNDQIPSPQGFIVDAIPLRDALLILKDFSAHIVQYIGGTFVYQERGLFISAGMLNMRCAVELNGRAMIATQDDIILTDGNTQESLCTHEVRRHIFRTLNPDATRYCQMVKRHLYDEVWFCYPTGSEPYCSEAAMFNTRTGRWGFRPLPQITGLSYGLVNNPDALVTWDSRANAWDNDPTFWDERFYSNSADEIVMCQPVDERDAPYTGNLTPQITFRTESTIISYGYTAEDLPSNLQGDPAGSLGPSVWLGKRIIVIGTGVTQQDVLQLAFESPPSGVTQFSIDFPGLGGGPWVANALPSPNGNVFTATIPSIHGYFEANANNPVTMEMNVDQRRGHVYVNDRGFDFDGSPVSAEVRRDGILLDGNPVNVKFASEIWPDLIGRDGDIINIQAGGQFVEGGPIFWEPPQQYCIGQDCAKTDIGVSGRYHSFRFYSDGGAPWRLYNYRVRFKLKGRF